MLRNIEGIVIRNQDYGETHKIVTIFSKQLGKITAIARGAKKTKSRMSSVTQLFIQGEYLIYLSKGLSTLQQGQIANSYRQISQNIEKTAYAAYIIELTDKLTDDKARDPFIYEQLILTLQWINDEEEFLIPVMMYELKLFRKGGFSPVLDRCVRCSSIEFPFAFSIEEGGLLCIRCRYLDNNAVGLGDSFVKLIHTLQTVGLERVGNISIKSENEKILRKLLDEYYDKYGGFLLKSKRFLAQIDLLK